jgi:2-aminoethylphosphonate-pyruvate transaminase
VAELMRGVREKIVAVCGGSQAYTSVLLTGSGTAALESAFASIVPPDGKMLVLQNGHYGRRLQEILDAHQVPCDCLSFDWGTAFDLLAFDQALADDSTITHVGVVHHETSTGMLNPLREIGEITARHRRSLAVDSISSLGSESLDVLEDHIDWCVGTANKCLEGLPGISFVCAPRSKLEALSEFPARGYYLDLHRHYVAQEEENAPAFTPAVQILYAFDRALDLTLEETVQARAERYGDRARELRAGLSQLGFRLLLEEEQFSNGVTVAHLPSGIRYEDLHDALKTRGFVIYATQKQLGPTVRIASMGQLSKNDITRFLAALQDVVAELSGRTLDVREKAA